MEYIVLLLFCVSIAIISVFVTNIIRIQSIKHELYDVPNERSSHKKLTPKGGGLAIVLLLLGTIITLFYFQRIELDLFLSLFVGIIVISITGLIDDYKNLSALLRFTIYFITAAFSIYVMDGFPAISINNYTFELGFFGYPLSILSLVWCTNLYNFMDGTDGFAAIQTICVALFCGTLLLLANEIASSLILFCLLSATVGFLYWNWSPAKIFMGDVGSCMIGFLFGLLAIYTEKKGLISIGIWLIVLAPFIGDTTFTLLKRMFNKEKWYIAHNSHAYQKLFRSGISHGKLAVGLLMTNILIIWPFAYFANLHSKYEFTMIILSYLVIFVVWSIVQNKKLIELKS